MASLDKIRTRIQLSAAASADFSDIRQKWVFDHAFSTGYSPEFVTTAAPSDVMKITKIVVTSFTLAPLATYDHNFFIAANNPQPSTGAPQPFTKLKFLVIQPTIGTVQLCSHPTSSIDGFGINNINSSSGINCNAMFPLVLLGESVDITALNNSIRLKNDSPAPRTVLLFYGGD